MVASTIRIWSITASCTTRGELPRVQVSKKASPSAIESSRRRGLASLLSAPEGAGLGERAREFLDRRHGDDALDAAGGAPASRVGADGRRLRAALAGWPGQAGGLLGADGALARHRLRGPRRRLGDSRA